jgi:xylan 1,4-beta-xylosidase
MPAFAPSAWRAALAALVLVCVVTGVALADDSRPREIVIDLERAERPLDRFFDLSIGADYPGTLRRPDSQAQLKVAVDELGFRYVRFHAIFHDVLGTVRVVDGRTVYDWSKIDLLYDDLLSKGNRRRSSTGRAILRTRGYPRGAI